MHPHLELPAKAAVVVPLLGKAHGAEALAELGDDLGGDARIEVAMECPRCVMTTHGFDDLPKDPAIMRVLVSAASGNLGVYASVAAQGTLEVGAPVTWSKTS